MDSDQAVSQRNTQSFGVFISHISEEAHIARKLKQHLEALLPGVRAFVSSDDIQLGEQWRELLEKVLHETKVMIVLCSKVSLRRPWIYFESGSGWLTSVQIIPVCHSGFRKERLPEPLKPFQCVDLIDERDFKALIGSVARHLGLAAPSDDRNREMFDALFQLPERGSGIGLVLTHGQSDWETGYTVFNLADSLPAGLNGHWSINPIRKYDDLISVSLHSYGGLIVGSPWRQRMEPETVTALSEFVMKGGRLLLLGFELGDRHHDANLNDLAAQFGLYFEADIVGPPDKQSKHYDEPVDFEVVQADEHDLTRGLRTIRLANVQTLRVLPKGIEWLRVGNNAACSPEEVVYRAGLFTHPRGKDRVKPNPQSGWLPVAVEAPAGLCGKGAVQAIGTWDILGRTAPFKNQDNLLLLGRLLEWLSGRDLSQNR